MLADDGRDALARFDESRDQWDLVDTNLTMPNLAGDQLVEKIKDSHSDLPIISHGSWDKIDDTWKLPIALILSKPIVGERPIDVVVSAIG